MRNESSKGGDRLAAAILVVAVAAAFWNAPSAGLVFDAPPIIEQDARIQEWEAPRLHDIVFGDYWGATHNSGLYRPLTTLSFAAQYALLGEGADPRGYLLVNVLLHAANVLLLFAILKRIGARRGVALAAALVWAVHPLTTEAVTNVVGRADLLAASGVLLGWRLHAGRAARASGGRETARRVGLLLAAALAIGAKESGVVLLPLLVLHDLLLGPRDEAADGPARARWLRRLRDAYAPCLAPLIAWLVLRSVAIGRADPIPAVDNPLLLLGPFASRLAAAAVLLRYAWLVVWPVTLSADYSWNALPVTAPAFPWLGAGAALLEVAALVLCWRLRRRAPRLAFLGIAWFVALAPACNVFVRVGTIFGERLAYLAAAFLIAALVVAVASALERLAAVRPSLRSGRARAAGRAAFGALLLALVLRTVARNRDWRSPLDLFESTVAAVPQSFKAQSSYASEVANDAVRRGTFAERIDVALEHARRAKEIVAVLPVEAWPAEALVNVAAFEGAKATLVPANEAARWRDLARADYEVALRLERTLRERTSPGANATTATDPPAGNWRLRKGFADVLRDSGERAAALDEYAKAAELAPRPEVLVDFAAALHEAGRDRDAVVAAARVVLLDPGADVAWSQVERYFAALEPGASAVVRAADGSRQFHTSSRLVRDLVHESARAQYAAMVRLRQAHAAEGFRAAMRSALGIDVAAK